MEAEIGEMATGENIIANVANEERTLADPPTSILVSLEPFDFEITITDVSRKNRQRQLTQISDSSRILTETGSNGTSPNYDALDAILENFLNNFFVQELKKLSVIYTPFDRIVLSREGNVVSTNSDNRRLQMDGIFNYFDDEELDNSHFYLRARQLASSVKKISYGGVAIFLQEGDLPEPNSDLVKTLQIQAFMTNKDTLLNAFTDPSLNLGAGNLITSYKTNLNQPSPTPTPSPRTSGSKSLDTIVLIAIIVAGLSMILLAFALYLAFTRRQKENSKYHSPSKTKSEGTSNGKNDMISPTSTNFVTSPNAPAQIIATSPIDDNISDYTDSIVTDTEARLAQEKAEKSRAQRRLQQLASMKLKKEEGPHDFVRISSRFNPRYVDKMEANPISPISTNTQENEPSKTSSYAHGLQKHNGSADPRQKRIGKTDNSTVDGGMSFNKDDHSLSSMESYGYSLDGIGDYSTVGGSTRYGY